MALGFAVGVKDGLDVGVVVVPAIEELLGGKTFVTLEGSNERLGDIENSVNGDKEGAVEGVADADGEGVLFVREGVGEGGFVCVGVGEGDLVLCIEMRDGLLIF